MGAQRLHFRKEEEEEREKVGEKVGQKEKEEEREGIEQRRPVPLWMAFFRDKMVSVQVATFPPSGKFPPLWPVSVFPTSGSPLCLPSPLSPVCGRNDRYIGRA